MHDKSNTILQNIPLSIFHLYIAQITIFNFNKIGRNSLLNFTCHHLISQSINSDCFLYSLRFLYLPLFPFMTLNNWKKVQYSTVCISNVHCSLSSASKDKLNNLWIKLTTDRQQNKSTLTLLFTEAMSVARSYLDVCLSNDTTVFTSKYIKSRSMLFSLLNSLPTNSSFGLYTYIISENRKLQQENFHLLIKQIKKLTQ